MLKLLNKNFRRLCSHFRWPNRHRSRPKIVIRRFGKMNPKAQNHAKLEVSNNGSATVYPNNQLDNPIRIATFNAALFSMAPAIPKEENFPSFGDENGDTLSYRRAFKVNSRTKSVNDRPKSILKQSPLHSNSMNGTENLSKQQKFAKSKLRVSINLPDNEISLLRNQKLNFSEGEKEGSSSRNISKFLKGKGPLKSSMSFPANIGYGGVVGRESYRSSRTVLEILRELDADILALQDVKAEEENAMKPLSDLASALGMDYVFAESWAPEYGNAVLSKWPIKRWKVQKIFDDTDFRNVLKATIDVPQAGEINLYCTHLDHLDENWRMKQINAIIQSNNEPHILVGGLNALDETDYSGERWTDIVKYYEEMGKPTPKVEVMRNLKSKQYTDAKDFAGECESVVMIAKGQSVQGTCKYGTRVDYILSSPNSPYKLVPGSYSVLSSKGTSDHHIVKVDITKANCSAAQENITGKRRQPRPKVVKITESSSSRGIWTTHTQDT
ncbi:Endonuclease/exonuclease/phosphatase protein [Quillaja saponaria]|uniref:Endonuclease/exonuclease/phosphatase protein n=1 Tax=Quillaja saponaria TaxID=32244 RepID=A0AAD7VEL8_QUISA|nr:Endonuclease/exonuclease/phosphatase protein [Quillaja saponaria]